MRVSTGFRTGAPFERFARSERTALRALPARRVPGARSGYAGRVAHDVFVDADTIRYNVPCRLV